MPLFEVAILETPTKKEVEEVNAQEKLIFGPEPIVANDGQSAAINTILGKGIKVDMTRMKVLVRPF